MARFKNICPGQHTFIIFKIPYIMKRFSLVDLPVARLNHVRKYLQFQNLNSFYFFGSYFEKVFVSSLFYLVFKTAQELHSHKNKHSKMRTMSFGTTATPSHGVFFFSQFLPPINDSKNPSLRLSFYSILYENFFSIIIIKKKIQYRSLHLETKKVQHQC